MSETDENTMKWKNYHQRRLKRPTIRFLVVISCFLSARGWQNNYCQTCYESILSTLSVTGLIWAWHHWWMCMHMSHWAVLHMESVALPLLYCQCFQLYFNQFRDQAPQFKCQQVSIGTRGVNANLGFKIYLGTETSQYTNNTSHVFVRVRSSEYNIYYLTILNTSL